MFCVLNMTTMQSDELPSHIGLRTKELAPLLVLWKNKNPRRNWKYLIVKSLIHELRPLAGKRHAHLLEFP